MKHLIITLLAATLLILSSNLVTACNTTYCSNRGNGTTLVGGTDNCSCSCNYPYFGLKCLSEYTTTGVSVLIDCHARYGTNEAMCAASVAQCYWNTSLGACVSKYGLSSENQTGVLETSEVHGTWCYQIIALPYSLTVYCLATIAFGVGSIGTLYMLRYRNTYSVLEENGERMFNQYYETRTVQYLTLFYCFLLFASSGLLAITVFVNYQDPSICVYVYFFVAYCIIQAFSIVWPIAWCIQFFMKYFESGEKKKIELDTVVKPTKPEREFNRGACQLRCF